MRFATICAALIWAAQGAAAQPAGCLDPGDVQDEDVRRHAETLAAAPALCLASLGFVEHGLDWRLTLITHLERPDGPTLILLHDNEDAAFDAALYGIRKYGGQVVAVEASGRRIFQAVQDPNRNFGETRAATASCRDMHLRPAPAFTRTLISFLNPAYPVITLHNNDDGYSGNGGRGTISAQRTSAVLTGLMSPTPGAGNLADEDNAILLAGTEPYDRNRAVQQVVRRLHQAGLNAIYEYVRPERNDCSLSNYVVLNGLGTYFNIEAQHGHAAAQKAMLDVLMDDRRLWQD